MLPRVLEPEAMDTAEEARDYDAMDHAAVNARFVADFRALHGPWRGGTALDVGTGTARIPIELCRVEPTARVLGIDLAAHMLALGRANVADAGLEDRIRLDLIDAKALPDQGERFEAVLSNSIVHHIPEPAGVLAGMTRLVAPGGTLFVRDLARPRDRDELDRLVATYAGAESPSARDLFAASLHAALTPDEVRALVAALGLPPDGVTMTSDRHWTWAWRRGEN
ncbi:MAG TPA: class I SAM-dependent methyltransferase [Isosphaeraceae bacterium]|jgi:ubiquinone/menaquinone biosynthesis C-methylase UbiE|nr:class I SAM-dependent methyltransferase [Isosphaeraceae bacterium]